MSIGYRSIELPAGTKAERGLLSRTAARLCADRAGLVKQRRSGA